MREPGTLPQLQPDYPLPPDKRCVLVPAGFCQGKALAAFVKRQGYGFAPYRLVPHLREPPAFGLGKHLLYLPSPLGVWALRQRTWCEVTFSGLITDGSLIPRPLTVKWLRTRLAWERVRLGGDVGSFFMRYHLRQGDSATDFAPLTIANWLNLFAAPLPEYSFAQDYVFTLGRGRDMESWLCRHGAE